MTTIQRCLLQVILLSSFMANAQAMPAILIPETTGGSATSYDSTRGWRFTTNQAILVTDLGVFDSNLDGLSETHDVGIFDSTGTLLVSVTVPNGGTATLINQFRSVSIAPLLLAAGQTFQIGATYLNGSGGTQIFFSNGMTVDPAITFDTGFASAGTGLVNPTSGDFNFRNSFFGPNFGFTLASAAGVPEMDSHPGTTLSILCLVLGIATKRRRS